MSTQVKVIDQLRDGGFIIVQVEGRPLSLNRAYNMEVAHDGKACYQCGFPTNHLSPRGRCLSCEYKRSLANEKENDELREQLQAYMDCVIEGKHNKFTAPWGTYGPDRSKYEVKKLIDLSSDHLIAILDTEVWHLKKDYIDIIYEILLDRKVVIPFTHQNRKPGDKPLSKEGTGG